MDPASSSSTRQGGPPPGRHQILAKVECVGLCFSDLKLLKQFDQHPRKSAVVKGLDAEALSEMPNYVPGGLPTGDVIGHFPEGFGIQTLDHAAFAGMLVELFQELQIGKAKSDAFDLGQSVPDRAGDLLAGVKLELAGSNELDGVLGRGEKLSLP